MLDLFWILFVAALILLIVLKMIGVRRVIVYEYQKGLKYTNDVFRIE